MKTLTDKKIVIGVTGGIAAYKTVELVRRLKEQGAIVRVVMTEAAQAFITPLTFQAVSGFFVHTHLLDPQAEAGMGHIALARWADLIVIAPASADFIAKLAHGFCGDLLSTLSVATTAKIYLAPAMNQQMWQNSATQNNVEILKEREVLFCGPACGTQACGEYGFGRMSEPDEILKAIQIFFSPKLLQGKRVMVTAGPTYEPIDPVRFLGNRSSGKMGFALAEAANAAGAEVTLISGPTTLSASSCITRINVETADSMQQAVMKKINDQDIFISCAAVADYRVEKPFSQKLAKAKDQWTLNLVRNPDILATVGQLSDRPFLVGFSAETENLLEKAQQKLKQKKCDLMIANDVSTPEQGFGSEDNACIVLSAGEPLYLPKMNKKELAHILMKIIVEIFARKLAQSTK